MPSWKEEKTMMTLTIFYTTNNFWGDRDMIMTEKEIKPSITVDETMKLVRKALNKICSDIEDHLQVYNDGDIIGEIQGHKYKSMSIYQNAELLGGDIYNVFAKDLCNCSDEFLFSKREVTKLIKTMVTNELEGL